MAKTIARREFLKRLVLGAAAVLVAPTVLSKLEPPEKRLANTIDILKTDFGPVVLRSGESRMEALQRAEREFVQGRVPSHGVGVQPAVESTAVGVGPDDYTSWRRRYAGRTPDNEVSMALSRIELMKGKITTLEFDRRHAIRIPLAYGEFKQVVPLGWKTLPPAS